MERFIFYRPTYPAHSFLSRKSFCQTHQGKMHSYVEKDQLYYEKEQAIEVGEEVFSKTKNIIIVEVFQSGITKPIASF